MSNFSLHHQKILTQTQALADRDAKKAAEVKERLIARNKEAAKLHLLRIQQILAQKPI
jgi:hypothetical protein